MLERDNNNPSLDTLIKLSEVFEISIDEMINNQIKSKDKARSVELFFLNADQDSMCFNESLLGKNKLTKNAFLVRTNQELSPPYPINSIAVFDKIDAEKFDTILVEHKETKELKFCTYVSNSVASSYNDRNSQFLLDEYDMLGVWVTTIVNKS